ncbi:MAG TPA: beta-propeller fold lactonase family protein [Acidobacteriaceae bacterium]
MSGSGKSGSTTTGTAQSEGSLPCAPGQPRRAPARSRLAGAASGLPLVSLLLLTGCGNFFDLPKGTGGGGGTTPSGDYLYVANANPSLNTIAGLSLSAGALSATTNSPYLLGATPTALALTPDNTLLYAASTLGGVFVYTASSGGALTLGNGGGAVAGVTAQSLVVDPTGAWLLALQGQATAAGPVLTVFAITPGTGKLTTQASIGLDAGTAGQLLLAPNTTGTNFLYAMLGTGGIDVLSFDTTTGSATKLALHYGPLGTNGYSDNRAASNPAGTRLFVAETGTNGVRSFSIGTDGSLKTLTGSPTAQGTGGSALLVDATGSFLYSADSAKSTINAFSISTTGVLALLATASYTTGTSPTDMVEDSSGGYLAVACAGGTPDLDVFPITASGALGAPVIATTGTSSPAVAYAIAASH